MVFITALSFVIRVSNIVNNIKLRIHSLKISLKSQLIRPQTFFYALENRIIDPKISRSKLKWETLFNTDQTEQGIDQITNLCDLY